MPELVVAGEQNLTATDHVAGPAETAAFSGKDRLIPGRPPGDASGGHAGLSGFVRMALAATPVWS